MRSPVANRRMLANSLHHLPPGSVAKRRTNPNRWLELTVGVRRRKPLPDLSALDAKRPGERTYMTRDQLRAEFGSDPAAIAAIEKFAAAHHLVVTRNEPASARLGVGGTVADISAAFGVKLLDYSHPKLGDFHARTGPVMLPTELGDAITGVFGLNNQRVMHRLPRQRQSVDPRLAASSQSRPGSSRLSLPRSTISPMPMRASQCIGLLEFGGGVEAADVTAYFQKIGAPAPRCADRRGRRGRRRSHRRSQFNRRGDARCRHRRRARRRGQGRGLFLDLRRKGTGRHPEYGHQRPGERSRACCRSAGAGTKTSPSTTAYCGRPRRSTMSTRASWPRRSSASRCASRPATTAPRRRSRTAMPM